MTQTGPPNALTNLTYYYNVGTTTPLATGLVFSDATFTSPTVTMNLSTPTVASNGGTATLTVNLGKTTPTTVTVVVKVSGTAPYADYSIAPTGGGNILPISSSNSTFAITFLQGRASARLHDQGQWGHDQHARDDRFRRGQRHERQPDRKCGARAGHHGRRRRHDRDRRR